MKQFLLKKNLKQKISFLIFCVLILVMNGCSSDTKTAGKIIFSSKAPLNFGVFPFVEDEKLIESLSPLVKYLEPKIGRKINILILNDYSELEKVIAQKKIEIGWFSQREGTNLNNQMSAICSPKVLEGSTYQGAIICHSESSIIKIQDLKDKSFSYVDRQSNSGFIYPNLLFKENGILPGTFFKKISFAGTHDRCLEDVINKKVDAGAVSDFILRNSDGSLREDLPVKVIAKTEKIKPDPIVIRNDLPEELKTSIQKYLVEADSIPENKAIFDRLNQNLKILGFTKFGKN